jgi:hypothetical protein
MIKVQSIKRKIVYGLSTTTMPCIKFTDNAPQKPLILHYVKQTTFKNIKLLI